MKEFTINLKTGSAGGKTVQAPFVTLSVAFFRVHTFHVRGLNAAGHEMPLGYFASPECAARTVEFLNSPQGGRRMGSAKAFLVDATIGYRYEPGEVAECAKGLPRATVKLPLFTRG